MRSLRRYISRLYKGSKRGLIAFCGIIVCDQETFSDDEEARNFIAVRYFEYDFENRAMYFFKRGIISPKDLPYFEESYLLCAVHGWIYVRGQIVKHEKGSLVYCET